jgi:hypothetical protein
MRWSSNHFRMMVTFLQDNVMETKHNEKDITYNIINSVLYIFCISTIQGKCLIA